MLKNVNCVINKEHQKKIDVDEVAFVDLKMQGYVFFSFQGICPIFITRRTL